jgi:hypothetical protein
VCVDVADCHGNAFGQAGPGGSLCGEAAGSAAKRRERVLEFVLCKGREGRVECTEKIGRRPDTVLVDALVTSRADVAGLDAAQLPDDPVGCFDPTVGRGVHLWIFLEQLQTFGELPFRRNAAAVSRQPGLAARGGERVDAIGVCLRGMVLPELHVCMRAVAELIGARQRCAVGEHGQYRARGEVGRDTDHLRWRDAARGDRLRYGLAQHIDVILGVLQGPVGRQRLAIHG